MNLKGLRATMKSVEIETVIGKTVRIAGGMDTRKMKMLIVIPDESDLRGMKKHLKKERRGEDAGVKRRLTKSVRRGVGGGKRGRGKEKGSNANQKMRAREGDTDRDAIDPAPESLTSHFDPIDLIDHLLET
jgi:hypothetical protein